MAYSLSWDRNHPGHIVYVLDASASMKGQRMEELLDVLLKVSNKLIKQSKDEEADGEIREYFTLSIFTYNSVVNKIFEGGVVKLKDTRDEAVRSNKPMFDINCEWQTYTATALREAAKDVKEWISKQAVAGIPTPAPVVIHITDGEPYGELYKSDPSPTAAEDDAIAAANELKSIHVPDGDTLLFNIHIEPGKKAYRFPSTPPSDSKLRFLYEASSELNDVFLERADRELKRLLDTTVIKKGSRFMISNETNKDVLIRLIQFGSMVSSIGKVYEPAKPV